MIEKPAVYIVDDDDGVRTSLQSLLESMNFRVKSFTSGEKFLAQYSIHKNGCIILDVRMPGMSGLQVQEAINEIHYAMPVIIMSGHGDISMAVQTMKEGALDFIEKPFDDEKIISTIETALTLDKQNKSKRLEYDALNARLSNLTPRERQVLALVAQERSNRSIAEELNLSIKTVEYHRAHMMDKLHARKLNHLLEMLRKYEISVN